MFDLKYFQGKLVSVFLVGLIVAVFVFSAGQVIKIWKDVSSNTAPFRVTVQGEGKIEAVPNIATFSVSVVTNSKNVQDAEQENSNKATKIVNYLKNNGIDAKDIKTGQFSVSPQYQYYDSRPCIFGEPCSTSRPPEITSYQIRNSIEVKVRKIEKVGELLKGVITNGGNEIYGPNFTMEDPEGLKAQARQEAIKDAKEKAKIIAENLDVRLGRVVDFNESFGGSPIYALEAGFERGGGIDKSISPPIEPGHEKITVNVSVTYELK